MIENFGEASSAYGYWEHDLGGNSIDFFEGVLFFLFFLGDFLMRGYRLL